MASGVQMGFNLFNINFKAINKMRREDAFKAGQDVANSVPQDEFLTLAFASILSSEKEGTENVNQFFGGLKSQVRRRWPGMRG